MYKSYLTEFNSGFISKFAQPIEITHVYLSANYFIQISTNYQDSGPPQPIETPEPTGLRLINGHPPDGTINKDGEFIIPPVSTTVLPYKMNTAHASGYYDGKTFYVAYSCVLNTWPYLWPVRDITLTPANGLTSGSLKITYREL